MRQCLHAHGFVVEPRSYSRQLLKEWSGSQLFCPQCGGAVYYRHGLFVTPHFAHAANSECGYGEPETAEHQAGKQWLQNWLEQLYPANDTRREVYVEEIRQRADVLTIFPNGQRLCIEYQCSPIEVAELRKRMDGYEQAGIAQIWIMGKSVFSGRPVNRFRLQGWEKVIWERQKVLYLFDSLERHNLDVLAHIVQVQGKKTVFACQDRCEWPLLSLKVTANGRVVHLDDSPLMEEGARTSAISKRKFLARKAAVAQRKKERANDFLSHPLRQFALARVGDCLSHPVFNQKLEGDQLFRIDHRLWQSYLFLTEIHKAYQKKAVYATGTKIPHLFLKHILTRDDRFPERPFRSVVTKYSDHRLADDRHVKAVHVLVYEYFCRLEKLGFLRNITPHKERITPPGMLFGRFEVLFDQFCPGAFGDTEAEIRQFFRQRNLCYLNGRWFEQKQNSLELLNLS
ncbi:competence protein CoiA [Brevibacillus parabrevis]|uniref:competence protein CoiA n=1 Tax=Brevibacillus parabrevis TaxID=54914 RepID=UPI002E1D1603|nr:competence protein CoiA family protein [Brevibacillus parabrevis]